MVIGAAHGTYKTNAILKALNKIWMIIGAKTPPVFTRARQRPIESTKRPGSDDIGTAPRCIAEKITLVEKIDPQTEIPRRKSEILGCNNPRNTTSSIRPAPMVAERITMSIEVENSEVFNCSSVSCPSNSGASHPT